jgi:hypothetical protein
VKLSTTVGKIDLVPNPTNAALLREFFHYMVFNGSSESHQNNNLKVLTAFAASLGSGGDHDGRDGNKQKAEDESAAAIADCDDNDVEQAEFDCFGIAANDIEVDLGGSPVGYVDGKLVEYN